MKTLKSVIGHCTPDRPQRLAVLCLLASMGASGCGGPSVYFAGYTRIGVDASVDGAGVGVRQSAVTLSPPRADGGAHDLAAVTDMDLSLTDLVISQDLATGDAANALSTDGNSLAPQRGTGQFEEDSRLLFGSFTSWSLLEVNAPDSASPGILFGFKRAVALRVPVRKDRIGATYAGVDINTTGDRHHGVPASALPGGVRNSYRFATGRPAVALAKQWLGNEGAGLRDDDAYGGY
ncbi:hypothetical protein [uncultured Thiohalocapsa sp.]|uniref:hypothetical protein n=1 Tax=uncultured Thiohalocapsa sp. TaxID=768990 RepID=UPI0025FA220E|nr:hypothetical protein [uncultured Thiohalocapsa sp.]